MHNETEHIITISTKSLLKVVGFVLAVWFVWFIRDLIFLLLVSLLFASLIEPFANRLASHSIPRGIAVLIVVVTIFSLFGILLMLVVPVILVEGIGFFTNINKLTSGFVNSAGVLKDFAFRAGFLDELLASFQSFQPAFTSTISGIFSTVKGFVHGLFSVVLTCVLTFYLVVQEDAVKQVFETIAPGHYKHKMAKFVFRVREKLGFWLRGQLLLSFLMACMVYVGLLLLGVPYALLFAVFAGMMEMIPYLGPIVSAIPPIFVAFASQPENPYIALWVLIMFIIFQQFENHVLVPKVMQRAVGLNPLVSIITILVGVKLVGVVGVFIAIPVATILTVCIELYNE